MTNQNYPHQKKLGRPIGRGSLQKNRTFVSLELFRERGVGRVSNLYFNFIPNFSSWKVLQEDTWHGFPPWRLDEGYTPANSKVRFQAFSETRQWLVMMLDGQGWKFNQHLPILVRFGIEYCRTGHSIHRDWWWPTSLR